MNGKPSVAKGLFDSVLAHTGRPDSVSYLHAMVNSAPPTVETEYLDFKGATDPTTGREIDPKKTWSEALAGFATTSGGVLIWGIDARKDASGVDHAGALNLVPNPAVWKSRLQELHLQATDPPVPGVAIEAFPDPAGGGKGFVVCYIPESDYKPHRAETANRRWMMRIGSNFVDVPPPVLRSLFFPQRRSYIFMQAAAKIEPSSQGIKSGVMHVNILLRLYNEGPATAVNLFVLARYVQGLKYTMKPFWIQNATAIGMQLRYDQPVHPGSMVEIADGVIEIPFTPGASRELGRDGTLDLEYQLYATDQFPQRIRFHFSEEDIKDQMMLKGFPEPIPPERYS